MISFFCTRCGAALETDDDRAGQSVRCVTCAGVVRTPDPANHIPYARLAPPRLDDLPVEAEVAPDEPPFATPFGDLDSLADANGASALEYGIASYPFPPRFRDEDALNELAARLERVDGGDPAGEADGMTECRVCGSTIANFVRKCPFCRNSLVGRA